jgi:hypothetical protein
MMVDSDPSIADQVRTEVIDRTPTPTPRPGPPRPVVAPPAKEKSSVWKILVPLLAVVAAGIGGGFWWLSQQTTAEPSTSTVQASDEQGSTPTGTAETTATDSVTDQAATPEQAETTTPQPDPTTPAAPSTGTISVINMMPSGLVLVDGTVQNGQTFEVSTGQHTIEMRQPGYVSLTERVTVIAGQTITIPFSSRPIQAQQTAPRPTPSRPAAPQYGVLSILLRPSPGGNVFIDGRLASATTTRLEETLQTGRHTVRIERDGYATVDTTITIAANDTTQLRLRLRREGG